MTIQNDIPFQQVIEALLNTEQVFPPKYLYQFSDLEADEIAGLAKVWPNVPTWRRQALMEDIVLLGQRDTLLSFESLGRMTLQDPEPAVRLLAIQALGEFEEQDLARSFLQLLSSDPEMEVRAAAATALGLYVYAGEIETISEKLNRQVVDGLLAVTRSQEAELVRRMALESLGYSSRDEVVGLIDAAYNSGSTEWVASALFAMGRSANNSWHPQVLASLLSVMPAIRLEAARAAGELELKEARSRLFELLDDPDEETRLASIWSLSQIGGEGVQLALEKLYSQSDSEEELAFLDEALDNLEYTEEVRLLPILDFPETDITGDLEEDEDITWFSDLEEEDEDEDEPD